MYVVEEYYIIVLSCMLTKQGSEVTLLKTSVYREKKYSYDCFYGVQHSVIMADFIMPETQHPIIVYPLSLPFKETCRTLGIYFR